MGGDWVLSVGQLNEYVRKQLAGDPMLRELRVRGEISGFKRHYSGHLYFSIKDEQARVQCVMFRQAAMGLGFEPRDGEQVVITGSASLYVRDGSYQIYCESMRREGAGELYIRFEKLKAKLAQEGLFDPALKKPIPLLPRRVGVITSPAGAALRDILRVSRRRNPRVDILICPAAVQGEGAAREIAAALDRLNRDGSVDVILCGRGGGSIEDLWAFNEEVVARAIARSRVPVISCVGHETDFTIADFVADLRAATPSMAAELAVPVRDELEGALDKAFARMLRAQKGRLTLLRERLQRLSASPLFKAPAAALIDPRREALGRARERMQNAQALRLQQARVKLQHMEQMLRSLNPAGVLDRGYALVRAGGRIALEAGVLSAGQEIEITMRGGSADAIVRRVNAEKEQANGGKDQEL